MVEWYVLHDAPGLIGVFAASSPRGAAFVCPFVFYEG